ncbi:MAG: hypothetical protein LUP91_15705 [Methylococcaceae bacterium]|nr:hypothetical protein [Methylococcaceae bacterium]
MVPCARKAASRGGSRGVGPAVAAVGGAAVDSDVVGRRGGGEGDEKAEQGEGGKALLAHARKAEPRAGESLTGGVKNS